MKTMLKIELRSDFCAGTGKNYAAVIDTDTAIDEYGFPYIPSRRIKDCLREIAKNDMDLSETDINRIFGETGKEYGGTLVIENAQIENYYALVEEVQTSIESGNISPNDITELFCSVRAGTAIENDTVKEGSLRFVRVVDRYNPLNKDKNPKPLTFFAPIEFKDGDEEIIKRIVKALRNLGLNRNRGFGYVNCDFDKDYFNEYEKSFNLCKNGVAFTEITDDNHYKLEYLVYLKDAVMLPSYDANHSLDYIPGTSVLGALAALYVKEHDSFSDLFVSHKVRFSNLYVSDEHGNDFYPVSKKYISEGGVNKEPKTEIVYHNAINTKESRENNGGLYAQHCLSSGQYFKGSIESDGRVMKELYPLFEKGMLSFGRSKTAQYSHCAVKSLDLRDMTENEEDLISVNGLAAFVCESDVVLIKDGRHTVEFEDLQFALKDRFSNISFISDVDSGFVKNTSITSHVISGYNAKWNLKKPQFPVIEAGSVVLFTADGDVKVPKCFYIGEKQNEGFGKIRFINNVKEYRIKENEDSDAEGKNNGNESELLRKINEKKKYDDILGESIKIAQEAKKRLNSSQIGRLMLMCKEADTYEDFEERIVSIKTKTVKKSAEKLFKKEKIEEATGVNTDNSGNWKKAQYFILKTLTVAKYLHKESEKGETK